MFNRSALLSVLLVLVWQLAAASLHAQTVITSLPYTITTSGLYVLNSNLSSPQASGYLIDIEASNVTLDFQGHYISGSVGNANQNTIGVYASERSNLTIRNGTIAYCAMGVSITGDGSNATNNVDQQIDNLRVTYCYYVGIDLEEAPASRITNCQISQIGTSTANTVIGINLNGPGVLVQGNIISGVTASGTGTSYGVFSDDGNTMRQNEISNATIGIDGGVYQDNVAFNCATTFGGGVNGGNNINGSPSN